MKDWLSRSFSRLSLLLVVLGAGVPLDAGAGEVTVFHSPDDSGVNVGAVKIASSGLTTLHVYIDGGSSPSSGLDPCCTGLGDEILGWDLSLGATGGLTIEAVSPAEEVVVNRTATALHMNGGNFIDGDLGPTKIADVQVQSNGEGTLAIIFGQVVGPALTLESLDPGTLVGVPEPSFNVLLVCGIAGLLILKRQSRARPAGATLLL
ncbi:MAG: hypothetical protein ACX98W_19635 [bacterium]